jgi:transposase
MSLQWALRREVPADTAAIGQKVLKPNNIYRQIGDHFDELFPQESEYAFMYDDRGRGAIPPLLMALVLTFQMVEKVGDRKAAELVASRIDWKYAMHLPLEYPGFDWSVLSEFRQRLLDHKQDRLVFDQFLSRLRKLGLIKRRGRVRTDSTHMLGVVERLSQLELVTESIRVALVAVTALAPSWVERMLPDSFVERYSEEQSEYGLSQEQVLQLLKRSGREGFWFLGQVDRSAYAEVRALSEVATLRTVLEQQFPKGPTEPPATRRPTGKDVIESPHEPDARFAVKRGKSWIGYKVQITETCDEDLPHLIVDIDVTSALRNDAPELPNIQARLEERGLLPSEQQVDQGYMSGEHIVRSADKGINLMGVPPQDTQSPEGFRQTDFEIDMQQKQARCPAGELSRVWVDKPDPNGGPPQIQVRFSGPACRACPHFGQCTPSRQGRSLTLHPFRAALLARREEAKTDAFRQLLHVRAGMEGTISETVRAHDLRHSRYRGSSKQTLQACFTALGTDLKRLTAWWTKQDEGQALESAA